MTIDTKGQRYITPFITLGTPGPSASLVGGNLLPISSQQLAGDLSGHISGLGVNLGVGHGATQAVNWSPQAGMAPAFSTQIGLGNRQAGLNVGYSFQDSPSCGIPGNMLDPNSPYYGQFLLP